MKPFDFEAGMAPVRPTVVLLHSSAASSRQWNALAQQLLPRYDVRLVDFHGHGSQRRWPEERPLRLADEAALVEPIVRSAGRVHLIGHSYGGAVALKVAERNPTAIASVAVYEPVLFRWLFEAEPYSDAAQEAHAIAAAMRKYLERGDAYRAAERFLNYWGGVGIWEALPADRRDGQAARMRAVLAHFGALAGDAPAVADVQRLRMPMLVLSGTRTPASTHRIAAMLRAALASAAHETIVGAGHMGPITHAAEVNARLQGFLDAQHFVALRTAA